MAIFPLQTKEAPGFNAIGGSRPQPWSCVLPTDERMNRWTIGKERHALVQDTAEAETGVANRTN